MPFRQYLPDMTTNRFTLFDTAIGSCAIVWGDRGVVGLQLPSADETATIARVRRRYRDVERGDPTADVRQAIEAIVALLEGERRDLSAIRLDMDRVPQFERTVYEIARTIPPGEVITYGEIAKRLGDPTAAQAVGVALGQNPFPIVVPCHRVVGAGTKLGGFSAPGGAKTKRRMLAIEGSPAAGTPDLFD
jgi:methylated-DNA-[protein]-cysteine S-methyltransferase